MAKKTWKATLAGRDASGARWELYHPSYGTYWGITMSAGSLLSVETGSKKMPAGEKVIDRFRAQWRDAISQAAG